MEGFINIGIFFTLLIAGYFIGSRREKEHFISLQKRELEMQDLPLFSSKKLSRPYSETKLFTGSIVIGQDYFKAVIALIINIFGGRIHAYEVLLDRARREAILRMKESASQWGAEEIANLKIETSSIQSGKRQNSGCCEIFVYATAGKNLSI